VELRDTDARAEIQKLDLMTINFIDLVNEIHRRGYGLSETTGMDFFREYPFINNLAGNYDRSGDGEYDSSYVFRITGENRLQPKQQIGLAGTLTLPAAAGEERVEVEYFPTDTVEDLIRRINNSGAELVAMLNQTGKLTVKGLPAADPGNPDFVIRHLEDSGQLLVGYAGLLADSGPGGAYDWGGADAVLNLNEAVEFAVAPLAHPAGWIEVNPALAVDTGSIASSLAPGGAAVGDGGAALAIAQLRYQPVMLGAIESFDEYFAQTVTEIGLKGEAAAQALETETLVLKELRDMRESLSGVNLDEEMANMVKYQHGYSAAARFVSEIDKMLDTIINRMGV
jgi:flagellar hook-associated protein 1 FlgK